MLPHDSVRHEDQECLAERSDDERERFDRELELADRIAEQASLVPGSPEAREEARRRLGRARRLAAADADEREAA
jgi:hypothetical protein